VGMCRAELHRRDFPAAARSALEGLQRLYHYPLGHFLLGIALTGMREYDRAIMAFRIALSLNPDYPQAHLRLAFLLRRLRRPEQAQEHFQMFRQLRASRRSGKPNVARPAILPTSKKEAPLTPAPPAVLPPLQDEVVIVSGLPRSGTSMLMQMLAAGGLPVLSDDLRQPDEDNPLGYFEYDPVKRLASDSTWLGDAKGKAVKIVAPLLARLPAEIECRVIFIERNLDEILESQARMLARRGEKISDTPARRERLKQEYGRLVARVKNFLASRPHTQLLCLDRSAVLRDPQGAAITVNGFLGGHLEVARMANQVKPELNRHTTA
jgi:tetratricopeptide (TPR) repeat protein